MIQSLLALPAAYRAFGRAIGGRFRDDYVAEYLRPSPGDRILDLGCGPGDILAYLPDVDYLGIDLDPRYIAAARTRFGDRGEFRCESVAEAALREPGAFDIAMANGVLHHLDDDEARRLLELARDALKPGGRFVAHDGCFVPGQSPVARRLLEMDRGRFVRTQEGYRTLAAGVFDDITSEIRHDMLRVPYTHHILVCRR